MIDGNTAALNEYMRRQDAADAEQEALDRIAADRQDDADYQIDALCHVVDDYMHLVRALVYGTQEEIDDAQSRLRELADQHIQNDVERDAESLLAPDEDSAYEAWRDRQEEN